MEKRHSDDSGSQHLPPEQRALANTKQHQRHHNPWRDQIEEQAAASSRGGGDHPHTREHVEAPLAKGTDIAQELSHRLPKLTDQQKKQLVDNAFIAGAIYSSRDRTYQKMIQEGTWGPQQSQELHQSIVGWMEKSDQNKERVATWVRELEKQPDKEDAIGNGYFEYPRYNEIQGTKDIFISMERSGMLASEFGFRGFSGKIVNDVGTRDGRFIDLFHDLDAAEVYGTDPDVAKITKAVNAGILDTKHALPTTLEEIPSELKGKIDVNVVFNLNPPLAKNEAFVQSLHDTLSPTGQVLMTVIETHVLEAVLLAMDKYFHVRAKQLWKSKDDCPHRYLIVGDKRPSE